MESLTGNIVSADGAIYAIRRDLYRPPADAAVTDDFALSTAVIEQGYRLVFESEACAHEMAISDADREFWRKVRLMTRGLRGVMLRKRLLNPLNFGFYAIILFSHKVLRRLIPIFLLLLFATSVLAGANGVIYMSTALIQTLFYSLAYTGFVLRHTFLGKKRCFYIPFFYCLANTASLLAVINTFRGKYIDLWKPQRHSIEL
jgi:cellulose synthase/poly-beta-1,6-N-acetylglucosamine synthase-like glycosyltransferase